MPGVVVVEPEPVVLPPVVVLGVLPAVPVVPPLPTVPLVLPPMLLLAPVLLVLPAEARWSRMHWSRATPVRWSQFATLGPVVVVLLPALGVLGVVVVVELELVDVLGEAVPELDVLGELELPALALPEAASIMHFSFSAPLMCSHLLAALVSLLELLGVVALGLLLELLPEVCAMDALATPSSAAATAAQRVFIFIRFSSRSVDMDCA